MKQSSLKRHLLASMLGLLTFSCMAILASIWISTSQSGKAQLRNSFEIAQSVLQSVFSNREALLINSAQVLTDDFGFKETVAIGDVSTIHSALVNHSARIEADMMAIINLDGQIVSATLDVPSKQGKVTFLKASTLDEVMRSGGLITWSVLGGKLYQTVLITVDAPTPIGIALIGFEVDQAVLATFTAVTQLHTSIEVQSSHYEPFSISSLKNGLSDEIKNTSVDSLSWIILPFLSQTFASESFTISDIDDTQINVIFSADVTERFSAYRRLQIGIIAIGLLTVSLAFSVAIWLSRRITKPIAQLVELTQTMANGAYQGRPLTDQRIKEVEQLSHSFQLMQVNVANREQKIRYQAEHDMLTGLLNKGRIAQIIAENLTHSRFNVVGFSIPDLRQINDVFGIDVADLCVSAFAKNLSTLEGTLARFSENEFLWLPNSQLNEFRLSELLDTVDYPVISDDIAIRPKFRLVSLICPENAASVDEVFKRINIAFDEANKQDKRVLMFENSFEQRHSRRLNIVTQLKHALNEGQRELSMVYQPKLNLPDNKVSKLEALIRWTNKDLGFVPPDEFIEIAEHANLIHALTRFVITQVCKDLVTIRAEHKDMCIAINLSARDIMSSDLLSWILDELSQYKLPTSALSFEITESDLVSDTEQAAIHLQAFRDAGFDLAIDDFGTGYSSLSYLQKLPVNEIKIDKSFVLNLSSNPGDVKIVQHIVELAHSFDLAVIAEGVEDEQALCILQQLGSDWAQGYYMSRPLKLADLLSYLASYLTDAQQTRAEEI
ncbi:EAL domain-containing protein [Glaciecola siphonariae]|uniref:EAL domain-containing protein n=1 Tax=Glaciecola siphonariae TaxID=521012 RepID=A0ABV9M0P0_9ALTE